MGPSMLRKTSKVRTASGDIQVDGRERSSDRAPRSGTHDGSSRPWWARWSRAARRPGVEPSPQADSPPAVEDLRRRIRGCLSRMDPGLRALLVMKILEGRSYREIAQASGLSVTEVGRLTHQALKDLSRGLGRFPNLGPLPQDGAVAPPPGPSES